MCLAVPGKVVYIDELSARVDFAGVQRETLIDLLPEVEVGDYVLVHAGFAIQRLDPAEACEILAQLEEIDALGVEAGKG
jgi:hydrogenase expression/formation protein HypC